MYDCCLSLVGFIKTHIVVCSVRDVSDILHVVVNALEHVMASGTKSDKVLSLLLGVVKSSYGRKLSSDLVRAQRINSAAALPFGDLFQFKPESDRGTSCIHVKILCLVLQGTSGVITVFHE